MHPKKILLGGLIVVLLGESVYTLSGGDILGGLFPRSVHTLSGFVEHLKGRAGYTAESGGIKTVTISGSLGETLGAQSVSSADESTDSTEHPKPKGAVEELGTTEPLPDLVVSSIQVTSAGLLEVVVTNTGEANALSGSLYSGYTYVYIDDLDDAEWKYAWKNFIQTSAAIQFIQVGKSSTITPEYLSAGTHEIKACVDTTEVVTESEEGNNCLEATVSVK